MNKQQIKVYIADDHPVFLSGLRMIIELDEDLEIIGEAADGLTALNEIQLKNPDVSVLDLNMPEKNGFEIVRGLQQRKIEAKVIFLTMHDEEATLNSAIDLGVKGYILKDSVVTEIVAAIKAVHKGEVYITPKLSKFLVSRNQSSTKFARQIQSLTQTERKILRLIAEQKTSSQIAEELFVSRRTIDSHRYNIGLKLNIRGINSLLKFAIENKSRVI